MPRNGNFRTLDNKLSQERVTEIKALFSQKYTIAWIRVAPAYKADNLNSKYIDKVKKGNKDLIESKS